MIGGSFSNPGGLYLTYKQFQALRALKLKEETKGLSDHLGKTKTKKKLYENGKGEEGVGYLTPLTAQRIAFPYTEERFMNGRVNIMAFPLGYGDDWLPEINYTIDGAEKEVLSPMRVGSPTANILTRIIHQWSTSGSASEGRRYYVAVVHPMSGKPLEKLHNFKWIPPQGIIEDDYVPENTRDRNSNIESMVVIGQYDIGHYHAALLYNLSKKEKSDDFVQDFVNQGLIQAKAREYLWEMSEDHIGHKGWTLAAEAGISDEEHLENLGKIEEKSAGEELLPPPPPPISILPPDTGGRNTKKTRKRRNKRSNRRSNNRRNKRTRRGNNKRSNKRSNRRDRRTKRRSKKKRRVKRTNKKRK